MKKYSYPVLALFAIVAIFSACKKDPANVKPEVTAGESITIQLPKDSATLSATAIDTDGQVTAYLWSKVSGPGSPIIDNPSSATTAVSDLSAGNYVFQILATDNSGATSSDTISVIVLAAQEVILTLQPADNQSEVHLFGNADAINLSDPVAPEIGAGAGTYLGDPVLIRALIKFDITSIPENAEIISAKLTLYSNPTPLNGIGGEANYGTNNAVLIQRITESWQYNTVKWQNQPSASSTGEIEIPHTNESTLDVVDLDVKGLLESMIAEGNNGFLIRLKNEVSYNFRIFCSSKYDDAAKHPKLEVVYK